MVELFASRLSRCVVALAISFAAVAVFVSPASARPHHRHSAERHGYVHHARHHHYRHHARSSRFERGAAQLRASGFADTQASYNPNANSGTANDGMAASSGFGGGSGLVSEARRYIGGNPTGRGSLWCARFMNMVLQHTGHQGTGSDMASSFAHYGTRVSGPQVGAIAVMSRGRRGGHVGIITGIDAQGNPIMISGNNGNRVREAPISRGRVYAYVMPN
ncbi:TIGR02594 family protein [Bradyrhizobium manausense]|uniref:TIGR02594 family protein n=1 Tax=Bradyrhizobium manausense TaxID=989370 RepID=UPI001BA93391|nr:TIGR02594 family protein [Bradyrhizobium manausense]MBR0834518.1 TIGR02594 family protein [Bradyrhizobium manausense]